MESTVALSVTLIVLVAAVLVAVTVRVMQRGSGRELARGSHFDNYLVTGFLKRGGMATLYAARDVKDHTNVALKIMHQHLMDDADLISKFLREGDILGVLNRKHPDAPIVKVIRHGREWDSFNGRPFIALELIRGFDLDDLVERGHRFSQVEALQIVHELASALKAAHTERTWHRDVSPGNIMLRMRDGHPVGLTLIDFGVAKHEYLSPHTPDGSIHGKPPYMSPEQCRGQQIDGRSDIYALGTVFYMLLTGTPPFISKNPLAIMRMHETAEVLPLPDTVPVPVRAIVERMLTKDREHRYQDMAAVLSELNGAMDTLGMSAFGAREEGNWHDTPEGETGEETGWHATLRARISRRTIRIAAGMIVVFAFIAGVIIAFQPGRGTEVGEQTFESISDTKSPVWLPVNVSGDFYGEFTVQALSPGAPCGVAVTSNGSGDYFRFLVSPGRLSYDRVVNGSEVSLYASEDPTLNPSLPIRIDVDILNGKSYMYLNGRQGYPVEFVGDDGGNRKIGCVLGKGMRVLYRYRISHIAK